MFNNATKLLSSSAQDLHQAMKMLGLNPSEQEVVDIPNIIARYNYELGLSYKFGSSCNQLCPDHAFWNPYVVRNGLIYFPEFCQLVLKWFRKDELQEEDFRENMFKVG